MWESLTLVLKCQVGAERWLSTPPTPPPRWQCGRSACSEHSALLEGSCRRDSGGGDVLKFIH